MIYVLHSHFEGATFPTSFDDLYNLHTRGPQDVSHTDQMILR